MACNDRQLTQAQREAAFAQQRTGVVRAVRPFSGSATVENLIDYINRELGPAVRQSRDAINECFLQVADNAPSANPLAFYFSESTAAADPTVGRIRLNASPQNTATVMRVSQSNARLVDVQPWLDVMAGGPTTPLGVVTLVDAINPARFIRWDLNTMTDQGAYWDLGITVIESSTANPFVEDEAVVIGFISGVSAAGSTIPVGALTPIAPDTFVGNITTGTAAPVAVPLASVDSTSVIYDATTHTFQRAALTGFAAATQNSNATTSAEPIVTYSASANMSAERVLTSSTSNTVSTSVANQIEVQSAAITGAIAIAANANASLFAGIRDNGLAEIDRTNLNFLSTTSIVAAIADDAGSDELELTFQRAAITGAVTIPLNSNTATLNSGWDDVLAVDATSGANTPIVSSGQSLLFANGASPSGISDSGTSLQMVASSNSAIDIRSIGNAKDIVLATQGTGGDIRFSPSSSSGGAIVCNNAGIVVGNPTNYAVAAGEGEVCCGGDDDRPVLVFRAGPDERALSFMALINKTAATAVSASTTVLDTTGTFTMPANTLTVGACFRCSYAYRFVRGATATALNLSSFFDVAAFPSTTIAAQTAAGTYEMRVEAEFTILTTGAGGTAMGWLSTYGTASTTPISTVSDIAIAIDTTSALAMRGAAQMSGSVSNTSIRCLGGYIKWIT